MVRLIKMLFRRVAVVVACCTMVVTAFGASRMETLEIVGGVTLISGLALLGWLLRGVP